MLPVSLRKLAYAFSPSIVHPYLRRIETSDVGLRLVRGVFWSLAGSVISRGLMLLATILVARMLGKTGYGELGMIQSTVGMFGIFAGFGLGLTATKHVAEFRQSDPERAGRIIGLSGLIAMGTGSLMAMGLLIFAPWLAEHIINAPHLVNVLRIGALVLFINALNGAQTGALAGFEAFKAIAYVNLAVGLLSFPILIYGAYYGGLTGAVWALAINLCINWLLNNIALRKEAQKSTVPLAIRGCFRERFVLWKFSLPAVVSGTMVVPVLWVGKSMLANQPDGYAGLGAITVAEGWRSILIFACGMITQVSFPVLSQLYGAGEGRLFKKTLFAQFWINGVIVTLGALIIILLSKPIMKMYGSEFNDSAVVLALIILSCVPMQLASVAGMVNNCVGKIWWGVLLNSLWALVYLLSTVFLIGYGALGLAWASVIAYCSHLVFTMIYIVWVFRTSPKLAEALA